MAVQSEAALENALIHALEQMSYEYVKIEEESNLRDNFKCQLEKHNRKQLAEIGREHFTESEFEKILLHLEKARADEMKTIIMEYIQHGTI